MKLLLFVERIRKLTYAILVGYLLNLVYASRHNFCSRLLYFLQVRIYSYSANQLIALQMYLHTILNLFKLFLTIRVLFNENVEIIIYWLEILFRSINFDKITTCGVVKGGSKLLEYE